MKTAREQLQERFAGLKGKGLRDMKFFLGHVNESTVEQVCAEVNRLYDEVAKGNVKVVESWGDSNRPKDAPAVVQATRN